MTAGTFRKDLISELPHLRRFARALSGDAAVADDLVQDCVERALTRSHLYDPARPLRAWLYAILRNIHISQWRKNSPLKGSKELDDIQGFEGSVAPAQEDGLTVS